MKYKRTARRNATQTSEDAAAWKAHGSPRAVLILTDGQPSGLDAPEGRLLTECAQRPVRVRPTLFMALTP
ncbi:MAG: hypothetical protein PSV26_07570 [Polaromonas sp.]|uniref:hypothetical protein n=1 Tax=Polaromonas sp. TaxID=1869339 RepID=UPI0024886457|nr:hypothetical protein [Polaromonas sp.]MDI1237325.1 hypothetical protein [Polaromonas sp.]MDI1341967.1 hypothetical protein [Polaromonas sp.]